MSLSYFEVAGTFLAAVTDSSNDADGEPDVEPISLTAVFTPNPTRAREAGVVYALRPISARTNTTTGALETIDGNPVSLVDHVGLDIAVIKYTVTFEDVVMPSASGAAVSLSNMSFTSPGDGSTVDLGTVSL